MVEFENCNFESNFAVSGGVGAIEKQGYFTINNSTLSLN
jgi:hypothetical protein